MSTGENNNSVNPNLGVRRPSEATSNEAMMQPELVEVKLEPAQKGMQNLGIKPLENYQAKPQEKRDYVGILTDKIFVYHHFKSEKELDSVEVQITILDLLFASIRSLEAEIIHSEHEGKQEYREQINIIMQENIVKNLQTLFLHRN